MSKQFVPANRADIRPGARVMVKFTGHDRPAKDLDEVSGTVLDKGTVKRGDLSFKLDVGAELPLVIRHGDYTGTALWVEVETKTRIAGYLAALRRGYTARERVVMVTLIGGPLEGATVPLTACHTPWLTLAITCKGQTGRYQSGRWVPA